MSALDAPEPTDQVPFAFLDITTTGTRVLAGTDDSTVSAGLGFNFDFYGAPFSTIFISTNGLMSFGTANPDFVHQDLTGPVSPNAPTVAVLWEDWTFIGPRSDAAYYQTLGGPGSHVFLVEWHNAVLFPGTGNPVTFEAALFEGSNALEFLYLNTDFINGAGATVGIRDTSGNTNGHNLQWSFNQGVIRSEEAILITAAVTTVPEPTSLALLGIGLAGLGFSRRRKLN